MNPITDLRDLKHRQILAGMMAFLGTLGPGFLVFFHYQRDVFLRLETVKLAILALGITVPFVLAGLFGQVAGYRGQVPRKDMPGLLLGAAFTASCVMNASLALCYFRGWTFRQFLLLAVGLQVVATVVQFADRQREVAKTNARVE